MGPFRTVEQFIDKAVACFRVLPFKIWAGKGCARAALTSDGLEGADAVLGIKMSIKASDLRVIAGVF